MLAASESKENECFKIKQKAVAIKVSDEPKVPGLFTNRPCPPPRIPPTLPVVQDPTLDHQDRQPLRWRHCGRAGLQLLAALPCLAMGPAELGPLPQAHGSAQTQPIPIPVEVSSARD